MDRGDAKKLPPSALPMCEVEPLRLEEEGSDRWAVGLERFGSSKGWPEGAQQSGLQCAADVSSKLPETGGEVWTAGVCKGYDLQSGSGSSGAAQL